MTLQVPPNPWTRPAKLVALGDVYIAMRSGRYAPSDAALVAQVRETMWGTNAYDAVQMAFAIISPACWFREGLAIQLIERPIEHIIALGGMEPGREAALIAQGVAVARMERPYVPLFEEGRRWLLERWPLLEPEAITEFRRQWARLLFED